MIIAVGSDHAGIPLRGVVLETIARCGHTVADFGADHAIPDDDYVDYAERVARSIQGGETARGIVICGSGVGASIAANKIPGVRASVCHDNYSARQGVEHDDMNVLCLGARVIGSALASEITATFLSAHFSGEARHTRRVAKIRKLDERVTDY